jgi:hypothetical protein
MDDYNFKDARDPTMAAALAADGNKDNGKKQQ